MVKISIGVCSYNRPLDCYDTVLSVLDQKLPLSVEVEIIVVDDGSANKMTHDQIQYIQNAGCIYVEHKSNQGLSSARNTAIDIATGQWFTFCDDDDRWSEQHISQMYNATLNNDCDVIILMDRKKSKSCKDVLSGRLTLKDMIVLGITPPVAAQMYKISALREVEGYDTRIKNGVDHDLWIALASASNPYLRSVWGEPPVVGTHHNSNRLTTNESKRRAEIQRSLDIWQSRIVTTFGHDFYMHFCESYEQNMNASFFMQNIKMFNVKKMLKNAMKLNVYISVLRLFEYITHRRCNLFPSYRKELL